MAVNKEILVQTAGKIAGELVASMQLRNTGEVVESFNEVFNRVLIAMDTKLETKDSKTTKGGRQVPIISQDGLKSRLDDALRAGSAVTTSTFQV